MRALREEKAAARATAAAEGRQPGPLGPPEQLGPPGPPKPAEGGAERSVQKMGMGELEIMAELDAAVIEDVALSDMVLEDDPNPNPNPPTLSLTL